MWEGETARYLRWWEQDCARIYVAELDGQLVGYSAVTVTSIPRKDVPARARPQPNPPVSFPALLLGALYVAKARRSSGAGKELLMAAVGIATKVRTAASCMFVILDARAEATGFYEKNGFVKFRDGERPLYALSLSGSPSGQDAGSAA